MIIYFLMSLALADSYCIGVVEGKRIAAIGIVSDQQQLLTPRGNPSPYFARIVETVSGDIRQVEFSLDSVIDGQGVPVSRVTLRQRDPKPVSHMADDGDRVVFLQSGSDESTCREVLRPRS